MQVSHETIYKSLYVRAKNRHIATLVDRKSRFTIILKLAGKDPKSVHDALLVTFKKMPAKYRKSLTWDRGMERAKQADLTKEIGLPVYFCDPQCPWQRGTNENTNSLIRQYFPKKPTYHHILKTHYMKSPLN
jgi:Transposase and inactivated derivatives, IS30 family